jgi:hypothetical protein
MMLHRSIPSAAAAFALALFALGGCGDDSVAPSNLDDEDMADTADPALRSLAPAQTDEHAGVPAGAQSFEITLENLTPATGAGSSQPFSPPVLAVHDPSVRIFRLGRPASEELALIAEDAINTPLVDKLRMSSHVSEVVEGDGVILPGSSSSWMITTRGGQRRLSLVFMLVNTNDGFGGVNALRLPLHGEIVRYVHALDAGSEENTELAAHIPGPCCGSHEVGPDTHERIRPHAGILGVGDLDPSIWGWSGPVAKLTIRALDPLYQVTLKNLTPDNGDGASQVFSPPVLATHSRKLRVPDVGDYASPELAALAEDGLTDPLVNWAQSTGFAAEVLTGTAPIFPGAEATYEIGTKFGARRLSLATMLVNTNDGFTGVSALRLPLGGRARWYLDAYDAGSEETTELAAHIPGPCCGSHGVGVDTHERIRPHAGILGVGDLDPKVYGWSDPVAMLEITRIR